MTGKEIDRDVLVDHTPDGMSERAPIDPPPDGLSSPSAEADLYRLIGERVSTYRRSAALSQLVLSEHVGVTRSSITNLELGRQRPPLGLLLRIATALELPDYRELLPSPAELAPAAEGPTERPTAIDHAFWRMVRRLLRRAFSTPTEHMTICSSTVDVVEVLVEDTNPLRTLSTLVVVRPLPQPVLVGHVEELVARVKELCVVRGILFTAATVAPDAGAIARHHGITLIDRASFRDLQESFDATSEAKHSNAPDARGRGEQPAPARTTLPKEARDQAEDNAAADDRMPMAVIAAPTRQPHGRRSKLS